jgi:pimeloyl-ACP methyl ester carboxylesterase
MDSITGDDPSSAVPPISLVLLPGLDGSGVLFRPLLRCLGIGIRPIVVTYPPDRPLGYEQLLPIVLAALPTSERFVLLGESFSGPLALMAAAGNPPYLAGVILCASFFRSPLWFRPGWLGRLMHPAAFRLFPALSRVKAAMRRGSENDLPALTAEALSEVRADVLACRARAALVVDVREQLRACHVPLLYLMAGRDRVVPAHNAREICAEYPSARVVRIESSHWLLQTRPAAAADAITNFVRAIHPIVGSRAPEGEAPAGPSQRLFDHS